MNADERHLLHLFRALPEAKRASLLDYADFLQQRGPIPAEEGGSPVPLAIPRPEDETVINAIRRLRETYPMLEREALLQETASFMTQHVLYKRPAPEVIDDLEALFRRHYDEAQAPGVTESPEGK